MKRALEASLKDKGLDDMGHTEEDAAGVGGEGWQAGVGRPAGVYFLVSASVPGLVCLFVASRLLSSIGEPSVV